MSVEIEDKDFGWDDMMSALTDDRSDHVVVGIMAEAGAEELEKAVRNEFGFKVTIGKKSFDVPERPFIRRSVDMHEKEIAEVGEKFGKAVLDGKLGKKQALQAWGEYLQTTIKNGITSRSLNLAENAESTIEMKGSDTPLVNEARMLNAIDVEVRQ